MVSQRRAKLRCPLRRRPAGGREAAPRHVRLPAGPAGRLDADVAVLATGNRPPALPCPVPASPRYVCDPWVPGALDGVADGSPVVVLGTGLTMLDVAISLTGAHPETVVRAVSRHGLLPREHRCPPGRAVQLPILQAPEGSPVDLPGLIRHVRAAAADAPDGWQAVVDALRPHVPGLWRRLSPLDKRLFLRHVARYRLLHCHHDQHGQQQGADLRCSGEQPGQQRPCRQHCQAEHDAVHRAPADHAPGRVPGSGNVTGPKAAPGDHLPRAASCRRTGADCSPRPPTRSGPASGPPGRSASGKPPTCAPWPRIFASSSTPSPGTTWTPPPGRSTRYWPRPAPGRSWIATTASRGTCTFTPRRTRWPRAGRLAGATGLAVVLGTQMKRRLGVCTAPHCDRVYVDTSRNGTRRYCSAACQNRVKTASFRSRHR